MSYSVCCFICANPATSGRANQSPTLLGAALELKAVAKKSQCDRCTGLCCRYFALPIETPQTRADYDDIRWFLCHKGVSVFVEDGDWYIQIKNKCRYLSEKDRRCRIYEKRPRICRQYRHSTCDLVEGEYDYKLHFTSDKQMQEHIRVKFDNNVNPPDLPARRMAGKRRIKHKSKAERRGKRQE